MRKFVFIAAFAVFGISTLASTPVLADCAADIEMVQETLKGPNPNVKNGSWNAAKNILKKAKAAHAGGDDKKCEKMIKKAKGKIEDANRGR